MKKISEADKRRLQGMIKLFNILNHSKFTIEDCMCTVRSIDNENFKCGKYNPDQDCKKLKERDWEGYNVCANYICARMK